MEVKDDQTAIGIRSLNEENIEKGFVYHQAYKISTDVLLLPANFQRPDEPSLSPSEEKELKMISEEALAILDTPENQDDQQKCRIYCCCSCKYLSSFPAEFQDHMRLVHQQEVEPKRQVELIPFFVKTPIVKKDFTCQFCDHETKKWSGMVKHLRCRHHFCTICNLKLGKRKLLIDHMIKVHEEKLVCKVCNKNYLFPTLHFNAAHKVGLKKKGPKEAIQSSIEEDVELTKVVINLGETVKQEEQIDQAKEDELVTKTDNIASNDKLTVTTDETPMIEDTIEGGEIKVGEVKDDDDNDDEEKPTEVLALFNVQKDDSFQCNVCKTTVNSSAELEKHMMTVHQVEVDDSAQDPGSVVILPGKELEKIQIELKPASIVPKEEIKEVKEEAEMQDDEEVKEEKEEDEVMIKEETKNYPCHLCQWIGCDEYHRRSHLFSKHNFCHHCKTSFETPLLVMMHYFDQCKEDVKEGIRAKNIIEN